MKRTSSIVVIVSILLLIGVGAWAYGNWRTYAPDRYITETETATGTEVSTVDTTTNTVTPGAQTFTKEEVAEHKDATSCYTIIKGAVYDLTMWVNMHPGGKQAILSLCGTDGTARFEAKHGTAENPNKALARFKIGLVAETSSNGSVSAGTDAGITVCTMDAKQCPDGSWVGRTGPKCEFVCPK